MKHMPKAIYRLSQESLYLLFSYILAVWYFILLLEQNIKQGVYKKKISAMYMPFKVTITVIENRKNLPRSCFSFPSLDFTIDLSDILVSLLLTFIFRRANIRNSHPWHFSNNNFGSVFCKIKFLKISWLLIQSARDFVVKF